MTKLIFPVASFLLFFLSACQDNPGKDGGAKNDHPGIFGDSIPVSNGLVGKVFLLPDTTRSLPDFDTLTPEDTRLYANEINVPWQKWTAGFPGLRDRFEWFGIEYTGSFKPQKAGLYMFKLISDDGSKLFIDDKLVINNDGLHTEWAARDTLFLSNDIHTIRLDYFQGPRYDLALQLYWHLGDSAEKIVPGKDFVLYPPKPASRWWIWLLAALAVLVVVGVIYKKRNRQLGFRRQGRPDGRPVLGADPGLGVH